jgi:hypothetical protein
MSKGSLGLLAAYWPEGTARYAHVPLERVTQYCVHRQAAAEPELTALQAGERALSYAELSRRVRSGGALLRARSEPGARVVVSGSDPLDLVVCALAALEADLCIWLAGPEVDPAALADFGATLGLGARAAEALPTLSADELAAGDAEATPPRPNLRLPVLVLARPGGGEVAHNHKTLVASAISLGSFFLLEPGAEVVLLEPPTGWLALGMLLATLHKAGTLRLGWDPAAAPHGRCDYVVLGMAEAERRYLGATPGLRDVRAAAGAIVGVEEPFAISRRRRLARRLGTPVLTVYGRNDLGPVVASHPTWWLDAAAGIPLPNVDCRPLDPASGASLAIGWDAVEEAEMGVKSSLAPAGGDIVDGWLRSRLIVHLDPTGLYFLRGTSRR